MIKLNTNSIFSVNICIRSFLSFNNSKGGYDMKNNHILESNRLFLIPIRHNDIPFFLEWGKDKEVMKFIPVTDIEQYLKEMIQLSHPFWVIYLKEQGKPIGSIGFNNNNIDKTVVELGITLGEKEEWGKSYAQEAIKKLLAHIASVGIKKVQVFIDKNNDKSLHLFDNLGFKLAKGGEKNMKKMELLLAAKSSDFETIGFGSFTFIEESQITSEINILALEICLQCDYGCPHCIQRNRHPNTLISDKILSECIDTFSRIKKQNKYISFVGAEPTQNIDSLSSLSKMAHEYEIETVLMTNGRYLSVERLAGRVDYIDASLDGISGERKSVYDHFGQKTKSWLNIKNAAESGEFKRVSVIITAMRNNLSKVSELIDFLFENTISVSLGFYMGDIGDPEILSEEEFKKIFSIAGKKTKPVTIVVPGIYHKYLQEQNVPYYYFGTGHKVICTKNIPGRLIRIEADGSIFKGCAHLSIKDQSAIDRLKIGDASYFNPNAWD